MHDESSITPTTARPRHGVLTLNGYGIRVAVESGHLIVEDGRGRERRRARFPRTTLELKRLVIIGHTGTISFDALRWLHDRGCGFMQLDADGSVIAASGPIGADDARLRRAQAVAGVTVAGMNIARDLLSRKLDGQSSVLDHIDGADASASEVRRLRETLAIGETITGLRIIEAQAAATYWEAWSNISVRFARKSAKRVPDHWHRFGSRTSPLSRSPRVASNPANAMLNYLYAMLEAESRLALLAVGLDPGLGVLHADQRNRDSFACDVMEAVRPAVDQFVLELLESRHFGADDFFETRQGVCRLMPTITMTLADSSSLWAHAIGSVVERIAKELHDQGELSGDRATPLTQANRRAGRARVRESKQQGKPSETGSRIETYGNEPPPSAASARARQAALPSACLECGTVLTNPHRKFCDGCLSDVRSEQQTSGFGPSGSAVLATLRAAGNDPAHGGTAGIARGQSNASHYAANAAWEQETVSGSGSTPDDFTRDILPRLQSIPLRAMANATGLTEGYCSFIRRGLKVPHRRHWETLANLSKDTTQQ